MNEITKKLLEALKSCERVMSVDLNGMAVIQPELKEARAAIKKAETVLAEPQDDEDGWIPWSGGECPLDRLTQVDVRYRNGDELMGAGPTWLAGSYNWNHNWNHDESDYDIIAYRIVKESDK